ncbi:MAG: hypothetical protein ACD_46C00279G0001 [uncultured bacterium]|nr:MAG: hypothetical protein ACD_46C00279G0001 [uncultured bacterium]
MDATKEHFSRSLGPLYLWGLGVGYVISGMYFGWNLGLPSGGTLGLAIAIFFITIMYAAFTFGYCELACAIPKAGGAFNYAAIALGSSWGFVTGIAQIIEFVFAPPAIAAAIGAYCHFYLPHVHPLIIATAAYFIFTTINIYGVKAAASLELIMTIVATLALIIFAITLLPHVKYQNLSHHAFPHGISGMFVALPFAIWFFLGIEGVANMAEETINPQRNIVIGFSLALLTIIVLCISIFISTVGIGGWEKIVYANSNATPSNSPLPLALGQIVSTNHFLFIMLIPVALMGLIASFHGLILSGGRSTYEFARFGFAPKKIATIHPQFKTPASALILNMLIGIFALLLGKTSEIITIAGFGALTIYIFSMISLLRLRHTQPHLIRPFCVPLYPYVPMIALAIAACSFVIITIYNFKLAAIYFGIVIFSFLCFKFLTFNKDPIIEFTLEVPT